MILQPSNRYFPGVYFDNTQQAIRNAVASSTVLSRGSLRARRKTICARKPAPNPIQFPDCPPLPHCDPCGDTGTDGCYGTFWLRTPDPANPGQYVPYTDGAILFAAIANSVPGEGGTWNGSFVMTYDACPYKIGFNTSLAFNTGPNGFVNGNGVGLGNFDPASDDRQWCWHYSAGIYTLKLGALLDIDPGFTIGWQGVSQTDTLDSIYTKTGGSLSGPATLQVTPTAP